MAPQSLLGGGGAVVVLAVVLREAVFNLLRPAPLLLPLPGVAFVEDDPELRVVPLRLAPGKPPLASSSEKSAVTKGCLSSSSASGRRL